MSKEEDIPTGTKWPKTDQYDSEISSDIYVGPATDDFLYRKTFNKNMVHMRTFTVYIVSHTYYIPSCIYK